MVIELLQKLYNYVTAPAGAYINRNRVENMLQDLFEENTNIVAKINEIIEKVNNIDPDNKIEDLGEIKSRLNNVENAIATANENQQTIMNTLLSKANSSDLTTKQDKFYISEIFQDNTPKQFDARLYNRLHVICSLYENSIKKYYCDKLYEYIKTINFTSEQDIINRCDLIFSSGNINAYDAHFEQYGVDWEGVEISVPETLRSQLVHDLGSTEEIVPAIAYITQNKYSGVQSINIEDDRGSISSIRDEDSTDFNIDLGNGFYGGIVPILYYEGPLIVMMKDIAYPDFVINVKIYKLKLNYE